MTWAMDEGHLGLDLGSRSRVSADAGAWSYSGVSEQG
ncbi:hypothetical protein SLEP1_g50269 [Rubroshorea leprosula]|uniref:Transposase n=1 Tax=Rubroshorea leprosula TaxID=152421 RepID=A0AAV5M0C5_9ROSI|nr:hypothetical protein SLEP1_g50269 [Rubroshorea leprosula]